ncbi:MAG: diguanylate cyclase [Oceanospirillales bacterium]|nr:diguanylate cyclase [Oceanospirillales bacterium]
MLIQLALMEEPSPTTLIVTLAGLAGLFLIPAVIFRAKIPKEDKEADKSFQTSFEEVAIGLVHVAPDGTFIRVNPYVCKFLGYSEQELLLLTFQELTLPEELAESITYIKAALSGEIEQSFSLIKRYRHKQGHLVWAKLTTTLIRDDQGNPDYFLSSIQDVSELKETEAKLDESLDKLKQAYHELEQNARKDGLTGALNITAFKACVQDAFQRFDRYRTPATLVFIDLDRFKEINDSHGHIAGDQVLTTLVAKLLNEVRLTDAVGRYGGDEFAVLLANSDEIQAEEFCNRLGKTVSLGLEEGQAIEVGMSVGISEISDDTQSVDDWLKRADHQMYSSKKSTPQDPSPAETTKGYPIG